MRDKVWVGEATGEKQDCETLTAVINGEKTSIPYDGKSSVLEAFISKGVDAPYSCQSGSCMACLGKVTQGKVYMDELYILSEDNVKAGECLTCQSFPAAKEVVINYDEV
ncbi:MAG: 2Fe-2S iron-sulfur cluster binding domain-containing protein [Bdellovibrionales bacterium]|nr:2Fe-2S iron-sulfur cluster binding domain-containing protein [Bdellovibrionales bacterium]